MFSAAIRNKWVPIWILIAAAPGWAQQRGPAGASFYDRGFDFYHEFYGPRAYTNPEAAANFRNLMADGVSLQPPFDAGLVDFVRNQRVHLMVDPSPQTKTDLSDSSVAAQQKTITDLAAMSGMRSVLWNFMPEWDQSGGSWVPDGRPRYSGLTKEQAYAKFMGYYQSAYPALRTLANQPAASRNHWLTAITDHGANTFYSYELGADICLLERSIDELGDISTGIAFLRGAARQYDRRWGVDVSTFRTSNNMATRYDEREVLLGGWSPSYLRRHYYIAYMAGAHVLRNEAASYYLSGTQLNPFGRMNKEFADFALTRHPDVGRTSVPTAILLDHYSGFDPKHWIYNQSDQVWYQDIAFSEGDRMINNFFRLAYPNHWLHGQTPGAPFNDASGKADARSFQGYLARGGDPRPYEPMNTTRYGHSIDVITNRATRNSLRAYKVIVVLGDVPIDTTLQAALESWVQEGGTLVITASQNSVFDESFLGIRVGRATKRGTTATWLADGSTIRETPFLYRAASVTTATVLATGDGAQPLLTANAVGSGRVIFSTTPYLQNAAQDQLLGIGTRLFDGLAAENSAVTITGSPVEYIVNQDSSRVIVTVVNNAARDWNGTIDFAIPGTVVGAREYVADQDVAWTMAAGKARLNGVVPAFDVKVYSLEFTAR